MPFPFRAAAVTMLGPWTDPSVILTISVSHSAGEPSETFQRHIKLPAMEPMTTDEEWVKEMLISLIEHL